MVCIGTDGRCKWFSMSPIGGGRFLTTIYQENIDDCCFLSGEIAENIKNGREMEDVQCVGTVILTREELKKLHTDPDICFTDIDSPDYDDYYIDVCGI